MTARTTRPHGLVGAWVLGLSEAVSSAEDILIADESSSADVAIAAVAEGDLPGEFTVTGINTVDDAAARSLLATLLESRGHGDDDEETEQSLHGSWLVILGNTPH